MPPTATSTIAANPTFHARDLLVNHVRSATRWRHARKASTIATIAARNTPPIWTHCGTVLNRNRTTCSAGLGSGLSTEIESARSESATWVPCWRAAITPINGLMMVPDRYLVRERYHQLLRSGQAGFGPSAPT